MSIRRAASAGDRTTTLLRAALQDNRLSFLARGILAVVLSRPRDWRTSAVDLARETPREGRDAIRTALRELQACGYLHRTRWQDPETGRWEWDWSISDEATTPTPMDKGAGQPEDGKSVVGVTCDDTDPGTVPDSPELPVRPEDGFPTDGDPYVGDPQVGEPSSYRGSRDRDLDTSMGPAPDERPVALLSAFMDGLTDHDKTAGTDLAARLNRRALVGDMTRLVHLGWSPLALRRWAEHAGWAGASPGAVVARVRDLGQPPEPPRSAVPASQVLCPRHPDHPAGRCPVCEQEALSIPAEVLVDQIAAVRAAAKRAREDETGVVEHDTAEGAFMGALTDLAKDV